jgi:hypothetical protein
MYGRPIGREALSSEKGLAAVEAEPFDALVRIELRALVAQSRALHESVKELERAIEAEARKRKGYDSLTSIKGIGTIGAAVLLTTIGDINDFASARHLASYFGLVPRVSNSNETMRSGRITKCGSKLGRTTLVQCGLIAMRFSPYLAAFHERVKKKRGSGKANIALARKLLDIVYRTLKNKWVFEDFAAYRLVGGVSPLRASTQQNQRGTKSGFIAFRPKLEAKKRGGEPESTPPEPARGRSTEYSPRRANLQLRRPPGARVASPRCPILPGAVMEYIGKT